MNSKHHSLNVSIIIHLIMEAILGGNWDFRGKHKDRWPNVGHTDDPI